MIGFSFGKKHAPGAGGKGRGESVKRQHRQEREQFQAVLESFKASRVEERLSVLDAFLSTERHVTLGELEVILRKKFPEVPADRGFLKETMDMFCKFGFAREHCFDSQDTTYEHHHLGTHHDHFICIRCGAIQEFENPDLEALQMQIAEDFQFHPLQHRMEIYGLCTKCMMSREQVLPLGFAANGERVKIVDLRMSRAEQQRLSAMGLSVGACIEVVSNLASGPFIVAWKETRIALGSDVVNRIFVAHSCRYGE